MNGKMNGTSTFLMTKIKKPCSKNKNDVYQASLTMKGWIIGSNIYKCVQLTQRGPFILGNRLQMKGAQN